MFESITRAVLAHKQIIIAAVAVVGLIAYMSPLPTAIAQLFGPSTNLSVNVPNVYVHLFDNQGVVHAGNADLQQHFAGIF
jgi:hypothetical protein